MRCNPELREESAASRSALVAAPARRMLPARRPLRMLRVSPDARPVPCARTLLACLTAGPLPMVGGPGLRLAGRDLGLDLPPSWPGLARPAEGRSLAARGQVRYSAKSEASDHGSHGALAG